MNVFTVHITASLEVEANDLEEVYKKLSPELDESFSEWGIDAIYG